MLFELETVGLMSVLLVGLRLGVVMYFSPLDAFGRVPRRIMVLFTLVLSSVLVYAFDVRMPAVGFAPWGIATAAAAELINGLSMVLGVYLAFSAFMIAGQLLDAQSGFAAAAILNPTTNTQEPMFGVLLHLLAIALFFLLGMHRLFFEGIVRSFAMVPLGSMVNVEGVAEALPRFVLMFVYGLVLAAPVLAGLLMLDVGVGMMSRSMPQMNIYFVTLPLRIGLGLLILVFSLRYLLPLVEEIFREIYRYWAALLSQ